MKKIEKTKQNIKVDELDELTRKKLFDKFIKAGGKVIDERETKRQTRVKKYTIPPPPQRSSQSLPPKQPQKQPVNTVQRSQKTFSMFIQEKLIKILIRVKLFMLGISGLSAHTAKPRFLENLLYTYKTALLQFQIQYLTIFNARSKKEIIARLDAINPIYYELISLIANIFDRSLFHEIESMYTQGTVPLQKLKKTITTLYKPLYIAYPYIELIELAYKHAFEIYASTENQKNFPFYEKRKIIRNSLYITFYKLLPRLHALMCYFHSLYLDISHPYIKTLLSITDSDLPGKRTAPQPTQEIPSEDKTINDSAKPQIPPDILKGLSLMSLSTSEITSFFTKDLSIHINPSDKAIITYALFRKFDEELSIVLTTNKIKYNIQFTELGKIDFKNRLTDCYNEMRKITESFHEYIHSLETYERVRMEKPLNNIQYIEYTQRLSQLEKKKNLLSKQFRMITKAVMDKIANELKILIEDMNTENKIVDNPQEILQFEAIESVKLLQNRKVYEAIQLAYLYAAAFSYRLSEGDLSGGFEFAEGESPLHVEDVSLHAQNTSSPSQSQQDSSSILKELEDFV